MWSGAKYVNIERATLLIKCPLVNLLNPCAVVGIYRPKNNDDSYAKMLHISLDTLRCSVVLLHRVE